MTDQTKPNPNDPEQVQEALRYLSDKLGFSEPAKTVTELMERLPPIKPEDAAKYLLGLEKIVDVVRTQKKDQAMPLTTPKITSGTFLYLMFAYLPGELVYTNSSAHWSEAVLWLKQQYGDQYPDFFSGIEFSRRRPPLLAYSSDVSETLTWLEFANVFWKRTNQLKFDMRSHREHRRTWEENVDIETRTIIQQLVDNLVEQKRDLIVVEDD